MCKYCLSLITCVRFDMLMSLSGLPIYLYLSISICIYRAMNIHTVYHLSYAYTYCVSSAGGGGWFVVWSFVVLFLSCGVLCGVDLVVCLCV